MSDLQLALKEAGLLDIVEAKAKELGTTIEGAIRSLQDTGAEVALRKKAEAYAGRAVTEEEFELFREFGTTWLSEVPPSAVEEWGSRNAD